MPVEASGTLKLDTQAYSLTVAVTHNGETVAFVGTQSGELKKVEHNFTIEKHTFFNITCIPPCPQALVELRYSHEI